ncbi:MAG: MBG domain-containing protein [Orrella sp.]
MVCLCTRNGATGKIINEGELKAKLDGYIALMAPEVRNQGVIVAERGTVALASGEHIQLDFGTGHKLQGITVTEQDLDAQIENKHAIIAEGGLVILSAKATAELRASVIKNSGQIVASAGANTVTMEGGRIILDGGAIETTESSQVLATGSTGGDVELTGEASLTIAGDIDVSGQDGQGGQVIASADDVALKNNSEITADGTEGGGTVLIGGDWKGGQEEASRLLPDREIKQAKRVVVEPDAAISASATENGDGGTVVVWSDTKFESGLTEVYGSIRATEAGLGIGGEIETSGHEVTLWGEFNTGNGGHWLIDPENIWIGDTFAVGTSLTTRQLTAQLSSFATGGTTGRSVTVQADNFMMIAGPITPFSIGSSHTANLTLDSGGSMLITAPIYDGLNTRLNLTLEAGTVIDQAQPIQIDGALSVASGGAWRTGYGVNVRAQAGITRVKPVGTVGLSNWFGGNLTTGSGDIDIAGDILITNNISMTTQGGDIRLRGSVASTTTEQAVLTGSDVFDVPSDVPVAELLVVGGGGSGGYAVGGGGGAGGLVWRMADADQISYVVGAGGAAGWRDDPSNRGDDTQASVRTSLGDQLNYVAYGGGGGASAHPDGGSEYVGAGIGGSGGGGMRYTAGQLSPATAILPTVAQSNAGGGFGGSYSEAADGAGGGGGGAISGGLNSNDTRGGNGGDGFRSAISGSWITYATGGGGAPPIVDGLNGSGGLGGSENVNNNAHGTASAVSPNTGSGGGARRPFSNTSQAGADGVIVVRYQTDGVSDLTLDAGAGKVTVDGTLGAPGYLQSKVNIGNTAIKGGVINLSGGVNLANNKRLTITNAQSSDVWSVRGTNANVHKYGSGDLLFKDLNGFTGEARIFNGSITNARAKVFSDQANVMLFPGTTWHFYEKGSENIDNGVQTIGGLGGDGTVKAYGNDPVLKVGGDNKNWAFQGTFTQDTDPLEFQKIGTGTQTLNLENSAGYSGDVKVQEGTLSISQDSGLGGGGANGYGRLILDGGRLEVTETMILNASRVFRVESESEIDVNSGKFFQYRNGIRGFGDIKLVGGGDVTIQNATSNSRTWHIKFGTLNTTTARALGSESDILVDSAGTWSVASFAPQSIRNLDGWGTVIADGPVTINPRDVVSEFFGEIRGKGSLTKNGPSEFVLYNPLQLSTVYLDDGTIRLTGGAVTWDGGSLGTTDLVVKPGTKLIVANSEATVGSIRATASTLNKLIDLSRTEASLTVKGNSTFDGRIGGSGSLVVDADVALQGKNTYTGNTEIKSGAILRLQGEGVLGATTISNTANGVYSGNIAINGTLIVEPLRPQRFNGALSGSGTITKDGSATMRVTNASGFHSTITVADGALQILANNALSSSASLELQGDAEFDLNNRNTSLGKLTSASSRSIARTQTTGILTLTGNGNDTFAGTLGGRGELIKQGTGELTLTGTMSPLLTTTINGGTVRLYRDTPSFGAYYVGSGGLVVESVSSGFSGPVNIDTTIANLSSLRIGKTTNTADINLQDIVAINGNVTIHAGGLNLSSVAMLSSNTEDMTINTSGLTGSGHVLIGAGTLTVNQSADATYDGVIRGDGQLVLGGSSTLTLTGKNAYTGNTTIGSGASLVVSGDGALGWSSGSAAYAGDIVINGNLFNHDANNEQLISGNISGAGDLVQTGPGDLIVTGDLTYAGSTTVDGSKLVIRHDAPSTANNTIGGTGSLTIEPATTAFDSDFDFTDWTLPSTLTGLTIGKASNTANIHVDRSISIAGPVSLLGGDISLDSNLTVTSAGDSVLLKSSGNISLIGEKSISTQGGSVILWANRDGQATGSYVALRSDFDSTTGAKIETNGGHIWIGGGSGTVNWNGLSVGDGYAVSGDLIDFLADPAGRSVNSGVFLQGVRLLSGGGSIRIAGKSEQNSGRGVITAGRVDIDSGAGTFELQALASNGAGALGAGWNHISESTAMNGNLTITSSNDTSAAILINADATLSVMPDGSIEDEGTGLTGVVSLMALNEGGVTFNTLGSSTRTDALGLRLGNDTSQPGHLEMLSSAGDVTLNAGERGIHAYNNDRSVTLGSKESSLIGSSSAALRLITSNLPAPGAVRFNTTGTVTIEPASSSFNSVFDLSDMTFASTVGGLSIGAPLNSSGIAVSADTTIDGSIQIYGGSVSIDQRLASTGGDITIISTDLSGTGELAPGADKSLTLTQTNASTFEGRISGAGVDLVKGGNAALTLTGGLTYGGDTTISEGSLTIRQDSLANVSKTFNGSGMLKLESASDSFAADVNFSDWTFASTLGGLTVGKATNESAINVDKATQVAGGVTLYGGNVLITEGLISTSGDILIDADTGSMLTRDADGVRIDGATARVQTLAQSLVTGATGAITIVGRGGDQTSLDSSKTNANGVFVHEGGSVIAGGSGKILITGYGGLTGKSVLHASNGVRVSSPDSTRSASIVTTNGDVEVLGVAGQSVGAIGNVGVHVRNFGRISAGGAGEVIVEGVAGGDSSTANNIGVRLRNDLNDARDAAYARITSEGGAIQVNGRSAFDTNGISLERSAYIAAMNAGQRWSSAVGIKVGSDNSVDANLSITPVGAIEITAKTLSGGIEIVPADGQTLTVSQSGDSVFGGHIRGAGVAFVKDDTGILTLGARNTYTGLTTVKAGTLKLGQSTGPVDGVSGFTPLGSADAGTVVESGATLDLGGFNVTVAEALTLEGHGVNQQGALINSASAYSRYAGAITLSGQATIDGKNWGIELFSEAGITANNHNLSLKGNYGVIQGGIALGHGSTTVEGFWSWLGNNTFTGQLRVNEGYLQIGDAQNEGVLQASSIHLHATGSILAINGASDRTLAVPITGSGVFLHAGTGVLTLDNIDQFNGQVLTTSNPVRILTDGDLSLSGLGRGELEINSSSLNWTTGLLPNSSSVANVDILPKQTSFTTPLDLAANVSFLSGLTIGGESNSSDVLIRKPIRVLHEIEITGRDITLLNEVLVQDQQADTRGTVRLTASRHITQSNKIVANGLGLLGSADVSLTNIGNDIGVIAGGSSPSRMGSLTLVNKGPLEIGAVNPTGIYSSGDVRIETLVGDILLAQNINTTSTSSTAVVLNAGKSANAGTAAGGNIVVSGTPSMTVGSGGRATLYSGSIGDSIGLSKMVGEQSGQYRYNADEWTDFTASNWTDLGAGSYGVFREQPRLTLTAGAQDVKYGDLPELTYSVSGLQLFDTAADAISGQPLMTSTATTNGDGFVNAGDYTTSVAAGRSKLGYAFDYVDGTFAVTPRSLAIVIDDKEKIYGSSEPTLTYQQSGDGLVGDDALQISLTRASGSNVGSYQIDSSFLMVYEDNFENSNYQVTVTPGNFEITPKSLTVTALSNQKVYGESDPSFDYEHTGLVGGDGFTGELSRHGGENVGSYLMTFGDLGIQDGNEGKNYDLNFVAADFTISQRPVSVTADFGQSKVYGANDPTLTYAVESVSTGRGLMPDDAITGVPDRTPGENVGFYSINQGTLDNPNYDISFTDALFAINRRPVTVTVDADQQKVYGNPDPKDFTYTAESQNGDRGLVNADQLTGGLERVSGESVGQYMVSIGTLDNPNYAITVQEDQFSIVKRPITVTPDQDQSKVYGEDDPVLRYSLEATGDERGLVNDDVFAGSLGRASGEDAALYAIHSGTLNNSNYQIEVLPTDFEIQQRPIGVLVDADQGKTYGAFDPTLTYTLTDEGYGASLIDGDVLAGALDRVAGEKVGAYAVQQGSLGNPNYDIEFASRDFTIARRELTVAIEAASKVYGDADPDLQARVAAGSLAKDAVQDGLEDVIGLLSRDAGENAKKYDINFSGGNEEANYQLNVTGLKDGFTIQPKTIVIAADDHSKIYGDSDPSFTYAIDQATPLVGNDSLAVKLSRQGGENVGVYEITPTTVSIADGNGGNNYQPILQAGELSINQKTITVTPTNTQKTYGDPDPVFGYTLSDSLVGNDSIDIDVLRMSGEDVGNYLMGMDERINDGNNGGNYDIRFSPTGFDINARPITVTALDRTKAYGEALSLGTNRFAVGGRGLALGDEIERVELDSLNDLATTPTANAGTYAGNITASNAQGSEGFKASNYDITYASGDLTIDPLAITITANNQTKVYGDSDPSLTYSADIGLVTGDRFIGALSRDAGEDVGAYSIKQNGLSIADSNGGGNYTLSFISRDLAITPRPITLTANSVSKTYGDNDPTLSVITSPSGQSMGLATTANGNVVNDSLDDVTGIVGREAGQNVGLYDIVLGSGNNAGAKVSNYAITLESDNNAFEITAARLSLTGGRQYDGTLDLASSDMSIAGVNGERFDGVGQASLTTKNVQTGQPLASLTGLSVVEAGNGLLSNYEPLAVDDTAVTITPRPVTLTPVSISKTYDGYAQYRPSQENLDVLSKQLVAGDQASAANMLFDNKEAGQGKTVTLSNVVIEDGNLGGNYTVTIADANDGIINPAPLTIAAANDAKFVTQPDETGFGGAIFNGFVAGETSKTDGVFQSAGAINRSNAATEAEGVYENVLTPSGWQAQNYTITYEPGDYTIVPADTLLVKAPSVNVEYADTLDLTTTLRAEYLDSADSQIKALQVQRDGNTYQVDDAVGGLVQFELNPADAEMSGSGFLAVGGYDLKAQNARILDQRHFESMVAVGSVNVVPRRLENTAAITEVQKTYDGNRAIQNIDLGADLQTAGIEVGDRVSFVGNGLFADRHVGTNKTVNIDLMLFGEDAGNYRLTQTSLSEKIGTITQRDSVRWVGENGGLWSNRTNWEDGALPDRNNVAQVLIPQGNRVTLDSDLTGPVQSAISNEGILLVQASSPLTLTNALSGAGRVDLTQSANTTLSGQSTLTGSINMGANSLTLGNAQALGRANLVSNKGKLSLNQDITLDELTIEGPVELITGIRTAGDQTYGGQITLATTGPNTFNLQSQMGSIVFNGTIDAGANAKTARRSLDVQATTGSIRVNERIGLDMTNMTAGQYLTHTGTNPWALSLTANDIYLAADITTYETQTYTGDVWVAASPDGSPAITLTSMDPAVMFMGRINDTEAGTHTLNVKAITTRTDRSELPQVEFAGLVGDVNALGGLNVLVGFQNPAQPNEPVGQLSEDLTNAIGQISIAQDIVTQNDQYYQANIVSVGGNQDAVVTLESRQGTVTVVLGQRAESGITGLGQLRLAQRTDVSIPSQDSDSIVSIVLSESLLGGLQERLMMKRFGTERHSLFINDRYDVNGNEVLFATNVEVGEITTLVCEDRPQTVVKQAKNC